MLKPQLFLWAEWEWIILDSAARNSLRVAACSAWSADLLLLRALKWSSEQCFMSCVMRVWFFIRKFLSSYWSMFRNTSCSYGNQWEFCPCLQIEQEQTPCLQHQTSWHKVRKLGGPAKLHWCGKVSPQIKRLPQEKQEGCSTRKGEPLPALSPEKIPNPLLGSFPLPAHPSRWRGKAEQQHLMAAEPHHSSEQYRYGSNLNFIAIWADISILHVENTPRSKTSKITWEFEHWICMCVIRHLGEGEASLQNVLFKTQISLGCFKLGP